jgi:hypothetical protein
MAGRLPQPWWHWLCLALLLCLCCLPWRPQAQAHTGVPSTVGTLDGDFPADRRETLAACPDDASWTVVNDQCGA